MITLVILICEWTGLVLKENHLLRCGDSFSLLIVLGLLHCLHCWNCFQKKLESWFILWSFFLLRLLSWLLYKSVRQPCIEYFFHVWSGAPSCYLDMLHKLQKRICRSDSPSLADEKNSNLAELVPLPHSCRRSVCYSN